MELENADDNLPEFFKVYVAQHSSQKLLIPGEFVDYMGGKNSGSADLVGPSRKMWRVELVEDGNDMYFSDGWQAFVDDNMIQDGDFLFIKFHGELAFSVVIYDESMCEKVVLSVDDCDQGRDDVQEIGQEQDEDKPVKRTHTGHFKANVSLFASEDNTEKRTPNSVNPSFEICISTSSVRGRYYLKFPSSFVCEHSLSYKSNEKMVLQTGINSNWKVSVLNSSGAIFLRKGWCAFAHENNIKAGDTCKFELLHRLKMLVHVTHRQGGIDPEKVNVAASKRSSNNSVGISLLRHGPSSVEEEQKASAMITPSFVSPVFVRQMKKYNVIQPRLMSIPCWFIKENSLQYKGKEKMILRTKTDSSWAVNIIQYKRKKYTFSGGWTAFVRDNKLKEGDTCKFELLNRLEMKVYITSLSRQD